MISPLTGIHISLNGSLTISILHDDDVRLHIFFKKKLVFSPLIYNTLLGIENDDALIFHLKDLDLEFTWPVGKIKEVLPDQGSHVAFSPLSCSFEATKAITSLVEEQNIPEAKIELVVDKVVVTSELSLGSGLGSSTALFVALSAALLALCDSVKLDKEVADIIQSPVSDDLVVTAKEVKPVKLMEMSQGFLQCMGVGQPSIENVIRTTLKYELLTKLTGRSWRRRLCSYAAPYTYPSIFVDHLFCLRSYHAM
ncbi:hypothetical protein ACS0TY_012432 [Phlomoides rotata]